MLAVCSEVTEQVLAERRTRLLRDLALRAGDSRRVETTVRDIGAILAEHPLDVPFALLYLGDAGGTLTLAEAVGVGPGDPAAPRIVPPDAPAPWPLHRAAAGETVRVDDVERWLALAGGPLGDPVREALVLPVGSLDVLVAGISPNRALDEGYTAFFELLRGQLSVALGNARSYEEERRRAEALAELDRAKTEFFANVSHEFRTPLTLMLGPLEDLLRRDLAPALRTELEVAHRNALRLLKLVNTLLEFSRIEAGRVEAVFEPVDLAALTADLASGFRSAAERAGVRLVVDAPPLPRPVYVDREQWEKVVLNLLSNALKHTFQGEIRVGLREAGGRAELAVRDTGVGIPPDEIPHLFERFHRVRGARSRTHEGSGIGLALVGELVKLHGGEIRVESAVDRGTTFTVALPFGAAHLPPERVASASGAPRAGEGTRGFVEEALRWLPVADATAEEPAAAPRRPVFAGARIVLADDNADMRAYVTRLLRAEGCEVEAVGDGTAALDAVRALAPDLVLTDVMMPGLDGFGLLRALRGNPATATLPVIMLSARAGEESRVDGLRAGADDYLAKPFSARELLARVGVNLELVRLRALAAARESELHAARAVSEARTGFLNTMSHELRTPLNAIAGYVDLLEMGIRGPLADAQREDLGRIRGAQRHLLGLIDNVLDFTQVQAGEVPYSRDEVRLADVLDEVGELVAPRLRDRVVLRWSDPGEIAAHADRRRVAQILHNLLTNAARFTPEGDEVEVRCEATAGDVFIHVADRGPGIPADALDAVFQPFVQVDRSLDRPGEGTGLGLAISRELARAMGGDLTVRSAPGEGSTFTLRLPRATEEAS
jgi:signal transduction histidine kinase